MGTKTFNNYESLLTFTRASKGHALRPVSYGTELVTNGTFEDNATGYTLIGCTLITSNSDPYDGSSSGLFTSTDSTGRATQNIATVVGRVYRLTAQAKYNSGDNGSIEILGVVENSSETYITSSDTDWKLIQYNFVATETEHQLRLRERGVNNDASFFVDNISIKEVTFDESDGTLTLFEHPDNIPRVEWVVNTEKTKFKNISSEILRAAGTQEPQATEFNVLVNGQKIGDITNNGTVSAFDASMYISWFEGSLTNQTYIDYIENVLNPYIETNLSKYLVDAPVGRQRAGLLVEESRTNLVRYSDLNLGWDDAATDVRTFNAGTAPDKTNTATEFNCATGGFLYDAITVTASTEYTFSWYAKAGTATAHVFAFYDESNSAFVQQQAYTLTGGEYVGDGWYRTSRTVTTPAGCTSIRVYPLRANDGGGGVSGAIGTTLIWGAQFEEGSFATSYIKTTGSTTTRSADVASIPVADFGFNANAGSLLVSYDTKGSNGTTYPRPAEINDGTGSNRMAFWLSPSNNVGFSVSDGGVNQGTIYNGGAQSVDTAIKSAGAYKLNDLAHSTNGTTAGTDTSATIPTVTTLRIGSQTTAQELNGHIKSIKYYPRRLTNAQLQDITS